MTLTRGSVAATKDEVFVDECELFMDEPLAAPGGASTD
jgi:hypothetical protein